MSFLSQVVTGVIMAALLLGGLICWDLFKDFLAGRNKSPQEKHAKNHPTSQSFPIHPLFEPWTPEDCNFLRNFFNTPQGHKLALICQHKCLDDAMKECAGDKAAPVAAGEQAMLHFIQNLCSTQIEKNLLSRAELAKTANHTGSGHSETVDSES